MCVFDVYVLCPLYIMLQLVTIKALHLYVGKDLVGYCIHHMQHDMILLLWSYY